MNLFDMSDKSRVTALKVVALVGTAGTFVNLYFLKKQTDLLLETVERRRKTVRKLDIATDIIRDLAEHSSIELLTEVKEKYEFDWVVSDIEDPEK